MLPRRFCLSLGLVLALNACADRDRTDGTSQYPDDSFVARTGRAFKKSNDLAVLTRAHTIAEARARIAAAPQDVVIADFCLPDGTATELLTPIADKAGLPVVVLIRPDEEKQAATEAKALPAASLVRFRLKRTEVFVSPSLPESRSTFRL